MQLPKAAITGINCVLPDFILTNKLLEEMVDTSDEWISSRTGIYERRILKGADKGTSAMASPAVKGLLEKTGTAPEEIDLLICATTTPDMQFPATANLISNDCGLVNAFSYDLNAACSGFIYALSTASSFIEAGRYKKIIVVGADKMSSIINYKDRQTCVIFGDGAGAVLLEADESGNGIIDSVLHSDGSGWVHLHQKAGGSRKPASAETVAAKEHYVYQEGKSVFKFAVTKLAEVSEEILTRNKLDKTEIDWLVPHQANLRIIDATRKWMELPKEKVMINIHKYGNTTNATIPLCLWEWEKQLKKGDNLILAAFGGGFTWGSIYIKWAYDSQ